MAFWLGRLSVKSKPEQQNKSELEKKITVREAELAQVKKQLKEEISSSKKQELEHKVRDLEQQLTALKNNLPPPQKPEQPEPDNNNEIKVKLDGRAWDKSGSELSEYFFSNLAKSNKDRKFFYIDQNHPQIKQLASQGKLQRDKKFIIHYRKIDSEDLKGTFFSFNEFNESLEITEV